LSGEIPRTLDSGGRKAATTSNTPSRFGHPAVKVASLD